MSDSALALAVSIDPLVSTIKLILKKVGQQQNLGAAKQLSLLSSLETINDKRLRQSIDLLLQEIARKHACTQERVVSLLLDITPSSPASSITLPLSIFSCGLGVLEALVVYLHDDKVLSFADIARALDRHPNTIWTAYHKAQQKTFSLNTNGEATIDLSSFLTSHTTLESLVLFLYQQGKTYKEIADLLGRDQRNVRATYLRALAKGGQQ